MDVGINYPWFNYGWDFGAAPPSWRSGPLPNWAAAVTNDLQFFVAIGLRVVRWFILADGLAYGTATDAPRPDTSPARAGQWRFHPPALGSDVVSHFGELLDRFVAVNAGATPARIQLLPVFIDHRFCLPGNRAIATSPDWVKQGRSDAINDASKRRDLLARALQPLLAASATPARRPMIYAWDIINEPDLVTAQWHPGPQPITEPAMRAFLEEAKAMIRTAGFRPTIGFNKVETILNTRIYADINQFHHYTSPRSPRPLPRHAFNPRYPAILGELATSSLHDTWPELGADQRVLHRLRVADRQGYPLALPWCYHRQTDRHGAWSYLVERDLQCFTHRRNCPPP